MSIELHCDQCSRLIRAPDDAGGKHGKCPYCKHDVYVPLPPTEEDIISLAPLDPDIERVSDELRQEGIRLAAAVDREDVAEKRSSATGKGARDVGRDNKPGEVVDLQTEVERFVMAMHGSKLEEAERVANRLKSSGTRARDYVQGLMVDQMPPKISNVPQPLVQGFLKALVARLS